METKYIIIPFDVQRAKRISNGEEEGKIVTRDGNDVRILCFDALGEYSIIALIKTADDEEDVETYNDDGFCYDDGESDDDLFIEIPIPAKINLRALKPFDKVLVRDEDDDYWRIDFFSHEDVEFNYRFICMKDKWRQCIPYEGNEHLLGTSNDPE